MTSEETVIPRARESLLGSLVGHAKRKRRRKVAAGLLVLFVAGLGLTQFGDGPQPILTTREDERETVPATSATSVPEVSEADPSVVSPTSGPATEIVEGAGEWTTAESGLNGSSHTDLFRMDESRILVVDTENSGGDVIGEIWNADSGEVSRIAESPLNWRTNAGMVWTGSELVVLGGSNGPGLAEFGAAYSPGTDTWRVIPGPTNQVDIELPIVGSAIWFEGEVILWQAGVAFDLDKGLWRQISEFPLGARARPSVTWSGSQLLVWGGCWVVGELCDETGNGSLKDGALYDVASDNWSVVPSTRLSPSTNMVSAWFGSGFVLVNTEIGPEGLNAASFNPLTGSWAELPSVPLSSRGFASLTTVGDSVVLFGGLDHSSDRALNDGVVLAQGSASWAPLPAAPIGRYLHSAVEFGGGIYVGQTFDGGVPMLLSNKDLQSVLSAAGQTPVVVSSESLQGDPKVSWNSFTGIWIESHDDVLWADRISRACSAPVWEEDEAVALATEFLVADGGDVSNVEVLDNATQALWLISIEECRYAFPAEAISKGPIRVRE